MATTMTVTMTDETCFQKLQSKMATIIYRWNVLHNISLLLLHAPYLLLIALDLLCSIQLQERERGNKNHHMME